MPSLEFGFRSRKFNSDWHQQLSSVSPDASTSEWNCKFIQKVGLQIILTGLSDTSYQVRSSTQIEWIVPPKYFEVLNS